MPADLKETPVNLPVPGVGKYVVLRGRVHGNRFFSLNDGFYRADMYEVLGTYSTCWDCQKFLGFPEHWRTPRRKDEPLRRRVSHPRSST